MFYLRHVLWTLTLQTGTVALTGVFVTFAFCIMSVNLLSLEVTAFSMAWIIMSLYVYFMAVIWCIAFVGAVQEWRTGISIAVVLWTIHCIVWVVLVAWSVIPAQHKNICIGSKCPDVLWLLDNPWRESTLNKNMPVDDGVREAPKNIEHPIYEKPPKPKSNRNLKMNKLTKKDKQIASNDSSNVIISNLTYRNAEYLLNKDTEINAKITDEYPGIPKNQECISFSILMSIIFAIIFLFSWMVLVGYQNEIQINTDFPSEI